MERRCGTALLIQCTHVGYHVGMRRLLIGLTLALLLVVSIAVGVTVARWPTLLP